MDIATVIGLAVGWLGVVGGSLLDHLDPRALLQLPAFVIIFFGTGGATLMSFPYDTAKEFWPVLKKAFKKQELDPGAIVTQLVGFATKARREGLLGLEEEA